jgi:putative chitinase
MAQQKFRVNNPAGMWVRTAPVVSEDTQKVLLPDGQVVEKLGETEKPNWWRISTTVEGAIVEGFSSKTLMIPDGAPANGGEPVSPTNISDLLARTLNAITEISPDARSGYLQAIREGGQMFEEHGITTPLRMSHFMAQVMAETGGLTVLRESMNYKVPRMLEIFGAHHSAKVTAAEAPGLAHNEHALAERVYGFGNPSKAQELGNTQPGDGFRYRGNGMLQTTGREAHRLMGLPFGLDFENNPDLVTLPEHALKPALKEWSNNNLNHFADQNDIRTITLRINGGLNGFEDRKTFFAKLRPRLINHT